MSSREVYPKDAIKALRKLGFSMVHKKGSHVRLVHADGRRVTVAMHSKPLFVGTLHSILRQAEITREDLEKKL